MYSPAAELFIPIGMKPAAVTRVPVSIGKAMAVQAKDAAFSRLSPSSRREIMVSTAIIASSTRRPNAMMRAPSEMRCSVIPIMSSSTKVIARTSGIAIVTTSPALSPSETKLTARTIATASTRARMKWFTNSSTTLGWSATLWSSIPTGSCRLDAFDQMVELFPEDLHVAARPHADDQRDGRLAVEAEELGGRILVARPHRRHVRERKIGVADTERGRGQFLRGIESSGDPHQDLLGIAADHTLSARWRSARPACR